MVVATSVGRVAVAIVVLSLAKNATVCLVALVCHITAGGGVVSVGVCGVVAGGGRDFGWIVVVVMVRAVVTLAVLIV